MFWYCDVIDKMANVRTSQSISYSNCNDIFKVKEGNECVCSYTLKEELEITLQELTSIARIIQLLQDILNAKPDLVAVSTKETN
jgi:hypothetical protein